MFILPGETRATVSASDLRAAAACEWGLLRAFDVMLGRAEAVPGGDDPVLERTVALGLAHEQRVLRELVRDHPGAVREIPRPPHTREGLEAAVAATRAALASDASVIYQAAFVAGRFAGYADFVVRDDAGRWQVWDTKLAREETVASLLQLASYADQLRSMGVPVADDAVLVLGNGDHRTFPLDVILPVARSRMTRLLGLLDAHQDSGLPALWGSEGVHACGRCPECEAELRAHDDVLLVAGVYTSQRKRLLAAGVTTMEELAERTDPVPDLPDSVLSRVRAQARLQRRQAATGEVTSEIIDALPIAALPPPSAGDVFFDFEGDPMWSEPGSRSSGLEYLFGVIEAPVGGAPPVFRAFWAHDRAQERQALRDFLDYVAERRKAFPDMHIYHYAAYEKSALLRLAARYGVGEQEVDDLLREGVLVDLYAVVRAAVRVSQESYSIKKLEPLYMGEELRRGPVATGGDSIVAYHEFVQARIEGREEEAVQRLESIRAYNEYDCLSTLRLRDWLLAQADGSGAGVGLVQVDVDAGTSEAGGSEGGTGQAGGGGAGAGGVDAAPGADRPAGTMWARAEALEQQLRELLGDKPAHERTRDEQALALVSAALQYNRREVKPYWWQHFDRLRHPVDEWAGQAEVFLVGRAEVVAEWGKTGNQKVLRRRLEVTGRQGRGSRPARVGDSYQVVYDVPPPPQLRPVSPALRVCETHATIIAVGAASTPTAPDQPGGDQTWILEETLPKKFEPFAAAPLALVPGPPPGTKHLDAAVADIAEQVAAEWPNLPARAGLDILRRTPPRLLGDAELPALDGSPEQFVTAITAATLALDHSYLAVQGPPGTGKTYVGAHVIARLVREHGWKVGVVAQSHAAVENVLDAVVRAGLDGARVGKYAPGRVDPPWRHFADRDRDLAEFTTAHAEAGYVVGGTAYDFTNPHRFAPGQLDLLVIDEAGQYSLATTLAASLVADRLLLLGDPQQLGEVSQGQHPEPVARSALGWLIAGRDTLDPAYGYFLASTWRMHPRLAERISELSYAGSLGSQDSVTAARSLDGVDPGVHVLPVAHRDNTVESVEEAQAIAARIGELLGVLWDDPDEPGGPRPLVAGDFRVVTPYNAQVARVREVLDAAGLPEVPVGTVDKFQGQEGVIVFVSMAASARSDVARGMRFLLDRNRLNVALSRGKWAAYVVHSPELTDFTPSSAHELLLLGAFLRLTRAPDVAPATTSADAPTRTYEQVTLW